MPATQARVLMRAILLVACWLCDVALAASWTVSVDEQQGGLPAVSKGGASALSSKFVFWGKNWAWADMPRQFKVTAPFEYAVSGKNQALNFDLAGRIKKPTNQQLMWEFDLDARGTTLDVIGGGMAFEFDVVKFRGELGEPELLPGNQGWAWGRAGANRMEMRFAPPLASVYFERGQKSEIRAFFYKGEVPQGKRRHTATLSLVGDMAVGPTTAERFGLDDHSTWPTNVLDWKTSPVDLSFLNASEKPAGKRGFVQAQKDKLIFEDGTVARFWGTNLTAATLFETSKEGVRLQARRLSELGFNLIRLHHHDSDWVNPNIFGEQKGADTQRLNAAMLDKLDWWIKCLKDEGLYIWLDLHVGRHFKAGDRIDGFEEISKGKPTVPLFGYNYVNASMQQAMKRFNEAYVTHTNSYTGVPYKDEPAIAMVLLTNENDVTHHFGNSLLPDKHVPKHNALYMAQAAAFSAKHGLPKDKVWRSWEHGPSKLFLNDLEHRFNVGMIAHLRALGVKVPIVTTNTWGSNPLSSLPALTTGGMVDVHAYGRVGDLEKNPAHAANLVHWMAAAQVAGKPLSVTEWNVEPFPVADRHVIALYVAASASMQGWDALMQYAYAQVPLDGPGGPSNWHAFNDPALIASLPAAALLYRQGQVREATTTYAFSPSKERLFNQEISPNNAVALRTAAEKGKLVVVMPQTKELPWLEQSVVPAGAKILTDPQQSLLGADAREVASDSGELRRHWEHGTFTINTPRAQAAMGWIGGRRFELGDVEIAATTRNATVAVQSLDGKPIAQSRNIMISLGARAVPQSDNQLPFYAEPVTGQISIRALAGLKPYLNKVQSQIASAPATQRLARTIASPSPEWSNSVTASITGEMVNLEARLRAQSDNWGPNHPQRAQLQHEIAALQEKLEDEKRRIALPVVAAAPPEKRSSKLEGGREVAFSYNNGRYLINLNRSLGTYWIVLK